MFLLKYVVAHLGEMLVLELGASTLCVVNPYPQNFMMRLNTTRLHWFMVFSVTYYLELHNTTTFD